MNGTYKVGTSDRGYIGYVTCEDEYAGRLMPWYPYIDIGGDFIDLPRTPSKSDAIRMVLDYLESDGGA